MRLSKICKPTCVLLRRTLYDSLKLTSLFVFYSGEHSTTTQYLQVYLCSTQENTLRLSKIDKSTFVLLLRRTLYNSPKYARLVVFYSEEHFTTTQYLQVYLCSTQENTLRLSKICKSSCVLLRRTLYNYPISSSLLMFHSGEHFKTIQNQQVCLCSTTQQNTLQLPNICKSTCVLLRRTLYNYQFLQDYLCSTQENTLQLPNICMSTCVLLPRRTLHNYPISASLFVNRTLHSKSSILVTSH